MSLIVHHVRYSTKPMMIQIFTMMIPAGYIRGRDLNKLATPDWVVLHPIDWLLKYAPDYPMANYVHNNLHIPTGYVKSWSCVQF